MATARPIQTPGVSANEGIFVYEWTLTSADPVGDPVSISPSYADRTVEFVFLSGSGATATLKGSLWADANFLPLTNQSGVEISTSVDDISTVSEAVWGIQPRLSTVGASAVVTVRVLMRK